MNKGTQLIGLMTCPHGGVKLGRVLSQRLFMPLCLLLSLSLFTDFAFAVQVPELYIAEVPVESQQNADRLRAAKTGLGNVVVRISGAREALTNSWIKIALDNPDKYLKQFRFIVSKSFDATEQRVRLNFDAELVDQLLRDAGLPIWGVNRPNLLVWLVQEEGSNRDIIGADDKSGLKQAIAEQALIRGLPLLFPLMDLEDKVTLSTVDAWGLFQDRLERASLRYNAEAILAGKVYPNAQGEWTGRWLFIFNGQTLSFDAQTKRLEDLPVEVINRVADYLANYYAINTSASLKDRVKVVVKGVNSTEDYARASTYLAKFAAVRDVFISQVDGDQLFLDLVTEGQQGQLRQAIALDNKLVPEPSLIGVDGRDILVFRWQP